MLTREGHVKLTDFGVCKNVNFWIMSLICGNKCHARKCIHQTRRQHGWARRAFSPRSYFSLFNTLWLWIGSLSIIVFDKELALRWALGIVLYSMLVGSGPFRSQGRNSNLLYRDIKEKEVTFPPEKVFKIFCPPIICLLVLGADQRISRGCARVFDKGRINFRNWLWIAVSRIQRIASEQKELRVWRNTSSSLTSIGPPWSRFGKDLSPVDKNI